MWTDEILSICHPEPQPLMESKKSATKPQTLICRLSPIWIIVVKSKLLKHHILHITLLKPPIKSSQ
ncbi:hypothetical protein Scep_014437 [Stephania cephalantha]|uniref:Uncharacterized protein n=1 Tax=Stephania cephalantha TaxID=152367 RepID=A0AAP0P304_9MAGN